MSITVNHIGNIIQHCGAVELFINDLITRYSHDSILADELIKMSLHKRADVLKKLLERERHEISLEELNKLIDDIKKLGNERNIIAHNPLSYEDPDVGDLMIMYYNKKGEEKTYGISDIDRILKLSVEVMKKLGHLNEYEHIE